MTKEGETEFLRQQISQIQMRFENDKKEQARLLQEQDKRSKAEIEQLKRDRNAMETQLQYQVCKLIFLYMLNRYAKLYDSNKE